MSLNHLKTIGPNIIPIKVLKLLINGLSQLTELFNLLFLRMCSYLILKTT